MDEEEAQIYLALVRHGPCRASTVSDAMAFSRTKVYRLLDTLVERCCADASLTSPTIYSHRPAEELVELRRQEIEEERRRLEKLETDVIGEIRALEETPEAPTGPAWTVLEGRPRILRRLRSMLQSTHGEILGVWGHPVDRFDLEPVEQARMTFHTQLERGANARVILDAEEAAPSDVGRWLESPALELRHHPLSRDLRFELVEGAGVLVWLVTDDAPHLHVDDEVAMWTDAPGLTGAKQLFFEQLWRQADPIETGRSG